MSVDRGRRILGFRRLYLAIMLIIAVIGAVTIGLSYSSHAQVHSRGHILNRRRPMNVLVGIQGTPGHPSFLGLLAVIKPNSRVLSVVPISSEMMVRVDHVREPLYRAVSVLSPKRATALVARSSGMRIDRYFYLTPKDLNLVLSALYYHTHNWPIGETPSVMLAELGFPHGHVSSATEVALLSNMINDLPSINPLVASSLLVITKNSTTDLSNNELFLLANYVRNDKLVPAHVLKNAKPLRRKHG